MNWLTDNAIWLALAFVILGAFTHANNAHGAGLDCKQVHKLATGVMTVRQMGTSAVKAMEIAGKSKLVVEMVMEAYEKPHYSTERYKKRTINQFANEWYMACLKHGK